MVGVIESKDQAESELKYVVARLRERADTDMSLADIISRASPPQAAGGEGEAIHPLPPSPEPARRALPGGVVCCTVA